MWTRLLDLKTTENFLIPPGTTFEIIASDGKNVEKSFEFPLIFQQIFSAFTDHDGLMQEKAANYKGEVLREKNIYDPFDETDIDLQTLDISSNLTDTEREQLATLIKRYRELFPKMGKRIGCTNSTAHVIETGDAKPVLCLPYKTSLKEQGLFQREVLKIAGS